MNFLKPIKLGKLSLSSNIIYAPLAGCTDYPFRKICSQFRPALLYCEMVKMDALVRFDSQTMHYLDYSEDMHPIGAQICGSNPKYAAKAAKIIQDLGFDTVDLNCGCPVDKVTKDGSGSGLLKKPHLIGEIISNMIAAVNIPVTLKIRAGWGENEIVAPKIVQIAEEAGAKAIYIHGRTREQAYKGNANWGWIKEAREHAKNILVMGNGDIFSPEAAENIFNQTQCDGVLISRGILGAPWICQDIAAHLSGELPVLRDGYFYKEALLNHLAAVSAYRNPEKAVVEMRKIGCWYFRKAAKAKKIREAINKAQELKEVKALIETYTWEDFILEPQEIMA